MSMDIHISRYSNFKELKKYCYSVASIVGLICIEVFGYKNPKAKTHAIDLGLGMQLTNILRDLSEDAKMGRIYLPLDEMKQFGYSEKELLSGVINRQFISLMEYQVNRARKYLNSGKLLLQYLPKRSRACPLILLGLYAVILDRIENQNYNVFNNRISLTTLEKGLLAIRLWIQSFLPMKKDPIV
jgi:phytoene synthase